MQRNAASNLVRPRALAHRHHLTHHPSTRQRSTTPPPPEEDFTSTSAYDREQNLHLLRLANQKYLHDARAEFEAFDRIAQKNLDAISALPTTIQHLPSIPAYTLGELREKIIRYQTNIPLARADAKVVREQLIDQQWEPPRASTDSRLQKLAEESKGWTEAQLRVKLQELEMEGEARKERLMQKAANHQQKVAETMARHDPFKAKREAVPSFEGDIRTEEKARLGWERKGLRDVKVDEWRDLGGWSKVRLTRSGKMEDEEGMGEVGGDRKAEPQD